MSLSRRLRLGVTGAALAVAGVGAAVIPAGPAVAFFSPPLFLDVRVDSPLHLVAGGAAVQVQVEATCTGPSAEVVVIVTQASGNGIAQGTGVADIGCTHAREFISVTVRADSTGKPFKVGNAFAEGGIFGCDGPTCGAEHDQESVKIKK
jgi:hypothetical protein